MTIKDIYNLMDMCRRFKFESSDTSGKSPEEVRAYAEGYIRCKSCVMAVLSTMKDPYMFDFIDYTEEMLETDIENELVKNVTSLLMELGTGFAFMGQQYHLEVGGKDFYIDLLFYNTKLRCYVAIDLKTGEFKPEQAGKMNFYLSALDDLVKAPEDNPSVGLILCRDENRTIAEYALRDMSKPIGVSEYHLCTDLPLDLKNALPAVEDIRSRIDMKK